MQYFEHGLLDRPPVIPANAVRAAQRGHVADGLRREEVTTHIGVKEIPVLALEQARVGVTQLELGMRAERPRIQLQHLLTELVSDDVLYLWFVQHAVHEIAKPQTSGANATAGEVDSHETALNFHGSQAHPDLTVEPHHGHVSEWGPPLLHVHVTGLRS